MMGLMKHWACKAPFWLSAVVLTACSLVNVRPTTSASPTTTTSSLRLLYQAGINGPAVAYPAWAPDGQSLIVVSQVDPMVLSNDLYRVEVSTGKKTTLIGYDSGALLDGPSFFPDEHRVLLHVVTGLNPAGIWTYDLLTKAFAFSAAAYVGMISPNGAQLAVFVGPGYQMNVFSEYSVRVLPIGASTGFREVFTSTVARGDVVGMAWSLDATKLAFSFTDERDPVQNSVTILHLVALSNDLPSTWPTEIPNAIYPTWSPDGRSLAAILPPDGWKSNGKLVIWDLGTSCSEELLGAGNLSSPVWSPAGDTIAVINSGSIYLLEISAARAEGRLRRSCR